jgi:hypothetical protein
MELTNTERRALQQIRDANRQGFAGAFTGRAIRRFTMKRLQERGLVHPERLVVCDGDGFALDQERFREGWLLTSEGERAFLAEGSTP